MFTPVSALSLEDLVPADHFYRHLDRVLDLSFVRKLVQRTYAPAGRPSIDPVVFFKLQLVMFFEDIRSDIFFLSENYSPAQNSIACPGHPQEYPLTKMAGSVNYC